MGIFGPLIVAYLFLGGAGGGALAALSLLEVVNSPRIALRRWYLPADFFSRAWCVCVVALGLSVVCLLADLGRPDRAMSLFASPALSPVSLGAWVLCLALSIASAFALSNAMAWWGLRARLAVPAGVAGVLVGAAVMTYTGVMLAGLPSVAAWQTPLLPVLFVMSGLSCGVALCLGCGAFVECRTPLSLPFFGMVRIDSAIIVVETLCLAVYVAWAFSSPAASAAAYGLVGGALRWWFWAGLVVCGLAVPLAMEHVLMFSNRRNQLLWIALFVLIGGLSLRFVVVGASAFDATQVQSLTTMLAVP